MSGSLSVRRVEQEEVKLLIAILVLIVICYKISTLAQKKKKTQQNELNYAVGNLGNLVRWSLIRWRLQLLTFQITKQNKYEDCYFSTIINYDIFILSIQLSLMLKN